MAKHTRGIRAAKQNNIQQIEHSEVFDDSLLPEAGEIEKLNAIDPSIIGWLKTRAEKEQEFRHDAFNRRVKIVDAHNQREHNTSRFGLTVYFLLVAGCIVCSYLLLQDNHKTEGSLFGGAAVVLALAVLISRKKPQAPEKP